MKRRHESANKDLRGTLDHNGSRVKHMKTSTYIDLTDETETPREIIHDLIQESGDQQKPIQLPDGTDVHRGTSSLCESCAVLQERSLLDSLETLEEGYAADLGAVNPVSTSCCEFCQLLATIKVSRGDDDNDDRTQSQHLYALRISKSPIWGMNGLVLGLCPELSEAEVANLLFERGVLCRTTSSWSAGPGESEFARGLSIQSRSIDFKQLRNWIDSCLKYHGKCRRYAAETPKPIDLKLIDCETRKIVRNESYVYIALRYVWGLPSLGPNYDDRPKNGALPDYLLPTIEDAVTATKKLGYRYLWIDRFCIDQTNDDEKAIQFGQMNLIYRQAEATIVAVEGSNPCFGLPGVGDRPRIPQPSACVGGIRYVSVMNDPTAKIESSIWSTRGWTYQEGYFSRRQLFFLEDRVYFRCYEGAATETICHLNYKGDSYASEATDDGERAAYEILGHLREYSGRQLTHDTDAINAVAGVFNDYGFRDGPTPHHFGVPIVRLSLWNSVALDSHLKERKRRATDAFMNGLSWQTHEMGERRNLWPSWTWAEWKTQFSYTPRKNLGERFASTIKFQSPLPKVLVEKHNGKLLDFELPEMIENLRRDVKDFSNFIHIDSWTCKLQISVMDDKHDDLHKFWPKLRNHNEQLAGRMEEFFGTIKCSPENIEIPVWPMYSSYVNGPAPEKQTPRFAPILDDGNEVVGIILSRLWLENAHWLFFMMLLHDNGDHHERIGHSFIHSSDLRDLGIRRKLISSADWPDDNHHQVPTRHITKIMDSIMRWKRLRLG